MTPWQRMKQLQVIFSPFTPVAVMSQHGVDSWLPPALLLAVQHAGSCRTAPQALQRPVLLRGM